MRYWSSTLRTYNCLFILILSWFYPAFILLLSWFYADFILIFKNSLYPNFIRIFKKVGKTLYRDFILISSRLMSNLTFKSYFNLSTLRFLTLSIIHTVLKNVDLTGFSHQHSYNTYWSYNRNFRVARIISY